MLVWICGWRKKVANDKYLLNPVWELMDAVCDVLNDNFLSLLKKQDIAISFCVCVCWWWFRYAWLMTLDLFLGAYCTTSIASSVCLHWCDTESLLPFWLTTDAYESSARENCEAKGSVIFLVCILISLYICGVLDATGQHHSSFIVTDEESCFVFCGDGMYQHIHSITLLQLFWCTKSSGLG